MAKSISTVGVGRVARALGRRLRQLGWSIDAVRARFEVFARKAVRYTIDGDAVAVRTARQMVRAFGGVPVNIPASKKTRYHASPSALAAGALLPAKIVKGECA